MKALKVEHNSKKIKRLAYFLLNDASMEIVSKLFGYSSMKIT